MFGAERTCSVLTRVWLLPVWAFPLFFLLLFPTIITIHLSSASPSSPAVTFGVYQSFLSLRYKFALHLMSSLRAKRTKQNAATIRMSTDSEHIKPFCSMWTRNGLSCTTGKSWMTVLQATASTIGLVRRNTSLIVYASSLTSLGQYVSGAGREIGFVSKAPY